MYIRQIGTCMYIYVIDRYMYVCIYDTSELSTEVPAYGANRFVWMKYKDWFTSPWVKSYQRFSLQVIHQRKTWMNLIGRFQYTNNFTFIPCDCWIWILFSPTSSSWRNFIQDHHIFALTGVFIGLPETGDDVIKEPDGLRLGRIWDVVDHREGSVLDPELRQQTRHPANRTQLFVNAVNDILSSPR